MSPSAQLPVTAVGVVALGVLLGRAAMVVGAVVLILMCLLAIHATLQDREAARWDAERPAPVPVEPDTLVEPYPLSPAPGGRRFRRARARTRMNPA
ncbi:hypothetical protein GCM10010123_42390 [Pilimelia anulata]|uniref:Uncharacterized protein n=1 Tax=Pilimelia anulata TaxID=53371 RepID=A0A8J3BBX5_9ACTN|nr:hypothetical protein [Pilimelia anulata]GGK07935.1 hypothetical protein GCM10010123_42390 [Pilimelia anulata]